MDTPERALVESFAKMVRELASKTGVCCHLVTATDDAEGNLHTATYTCTKPIKGDVELHKIFAEAVCDLTSKAIGTLVDAVEAAENSSTTKVKN